MADASETLTAEQCQALIDEALDRDRLDAIARANRHRFETAEPFRHVAIDEFLPEDLLRRVVDEFPTPGEGVWDHFDNEREVKFALDDSRDMGVTTRMLLNELNSATFMQFLEKLTGIEGLVGDPYLLGGGLHAIKPGGFLKVHADFNRHDHLHLERRLNGLVYLNADWDDSYGGHLEIWDKGMKKLYDRILPVMGRFVVFATSDTSWHGHPDPLTCPPGRMRQSLALYYYTKDRPSAEQSSGHTTIFKRRPGETMSTRPNMHELSRRWTPPALHDWASAMKRKRASRTSEQR